MNFSGALYQLLPLPTYLVTQNASNKRLGSLEFQMTLTCMVESMREAFPGVMASSGVCIAADTM